MLNSPQSKPRAGFLTLLLFVSGATLSASCDKSPKEGAAPQAAASPAPPVPWGTIQPPAQVGLPSGTPATQPTRLPLKTFHGKGVIHAVHLEEGWFEIDHEDIEGYMPAMRMQWRVRDRVMLKPLSAGDKVDFTIQDDNGSELITELKKAAP